MTTIMPESERLRKAVRWISEEAQGDAKTSEIVTEASRRFNLSPKEEDYLGRFLSENENETLGGAEAE
jgi:hypothetical protein